MPKFMDTSGKPAAQMPRSHIQRSLGLGLDDIHDRLGLREIETAVQECTLREFAALSRPRPMRIGKSQRLFERHPAAMALQLHHILLRIGMRRTHDETDSLIHHCTIIAHNLPEKRLIGACLPKRPAALRPKNPLCCFNGSLSADADDADAALTTGRRNGTDGISLLHDAPPSFYQKKAASTK